MLPGMSLFQTRSATTELRPGRLVAPRRRADKEVTPGRCGNLDYCTIGMQRVLVQVPLTQAFVCPECGGPLRPPIGHTSAGRRDWLPVLRIGVLVTASAVSLASGYAIGRLQDRAKAVARSAALDDGAGLVVASRSLGLTEPPAAQTAAPPATLPIVVAERPYPVRGQGAEASPPALHLLRETRFGQVTIDCLLEMPAGKPACEAADVRGADALSAAAVAWLQGLTVRYAARGREGATVAADHRWRVVLQDFSGTARRAEASR